MNYLNYWKLNDKPFEGTRNTKYFYPSGNHAEALERLLYIIRDRNMNFGLLTGGIGSGKTITKTILEHQLLKENFEVVSIENACFPFHAILIEIISQLQKHKIDIKETDEYTAMNILKDFLVKIVIENNRHLVILLDEAHLLSKECLDKIKNITNICAEDENYITIILIGQSELKPLIRSLPQLDQRVSLRYHLKYLSLGEVEGYINYRLKIAGCSDHEIFCDEATNLIYKVTRGIPREINRTCRLALDSAFSLNEKNIKEDIIRSILKDINVQSSTADDIGKIDPIHKKLPNNNEVLLPLGHGDSQKSNFPKPISKRVFLLDDSSTKENALFDDLINLGYSAILSKEKNKYMTAIPKQIDLVIIKLNCNNPNDVTLFKNLASLNNINGTPLLIVMDPPSSFKTNKEKLNKLWELSGKKVLYSPFKREVLEHKIEALF